MKRGLAILLLFLYSLPLLSNNCQLHYCGGKLKNFSFFKFDQKSCCGKKKMAKGCCKDVQLICKADKHEAVQSPKVFLQKEVKECVPAELQTVFIPAPLRVIIKSSHAPPDIMGIPIRVLNGNFRI